MQQVRGTRSVKTKCLFSGEVFEPANSLPPSAFPEQYAIEFERDEDGDWLRDENKKLIPKAWAPNPYVLNASEWPQQSADTPRLNCWRGMRYAVRHKLKFDNYMTIVKNRYRLEPNPEHVECTLTDEDVSRFKYVNRAMYRPETRMQYVKKLEKKKKQRAQRITFALAFTVTSLSAFLAYKYGMQMQLMWTLRNFDQNSFIDQVFDVTSYFVTSEPRVMNLLGVISIFVFRSSFSHFAGSLC